MGVFARTGRPALELLGSSLPNPKVSHSHQGLNFWYRYYAGYSAEFVHFVLQKFGPSVQGPVLDPWNGTGTTTLVSAMSGYDSIGVDVNPALSVIARARLLRSDVYGSINSMAEDILEHSYPCVLEDEPLLRWLNEPTAAQLRGMQMSTQRLLVSSGASADRPLHGTTELSGLAAFFYVALFATMRELLKGAIGTNPTWWKKLQSEDLLSFSTSEVRQTYLSSVQRLAEGLINPTSDRGAVNSRIVVGDSRSLPNQSNSVAAVVSSPPYCTRIDYAMATLPELSMLNVTDEDLRLLRDRMVGTPTMTREFSLPDNWGDAAMTFLDNVATHSSTASSTYYLKYFLQYFTSMSKSLDEIARVLCTGAPCVLVVQDSHYKEVRNDVATIVSEMAEGKGLCLRERYDFPVMKSKRSINTRSRKYGPSVGAIESVLVLTRATSA